MPPFYMNVKEIINLVSGLSIGLDEPTESDSVIFLKYLNLAYFEILRSTILKNPIYPKLRETVQSTDGVLDATAQSIFSIRSVYLPDSNTQLTGTNLDFISESDPSLSQTSTNPQFYYYDSGKINVYPLYTGNVGIVYSPNPEMLTINGLSYDIYIPELYHSVLIDGTTYYLFQSETGFKNEMKMQTAMKRWEDGKSLLSAYLSGLGGQKTYSTYSVV